MPITQTMIVLGETKGNVFAGLSCQKLFFITTNIQNGTIKPCKRNQVFTRYREFKGI